MYYAPEQGKPFNTKHVITTLGHTLSVAVFYIHTTIFRRVLQSDGVVGIATGYGLDGPGIGSRWGRDFPHLSQPVLGPTQPPVQWVLGLSQGERAAGA